MQRIRLTNGNRDVIVFSDNSNMEPLPGIFTVNRSGKKVKFAPGNLFWDGSEFAFEKHQYDYPTIWNPNHVGHFYWSKDADITRAKKFDEEDISETDPFFATDGGAVDGYTILSIEEWHYLINRALAKNSTNKFAFFIDGKKCSILKPDGFNGTIADIYTAEEWRQAEVQFGLVALPWAGTRNNINIRNTGTCHLWSSTLCEYDPTSAYCVFFFATVCGMDDIDRDNGYCIRPVRII